MSQARPRRPPLTAVAMVAVRRPWQLLAAITLLTLVATAAGFNVGDRLSAGGYTPSSSESAYADRVLAERFDRAAPNLVLLAQTGDRSVDCAPCADAGRRLTDRIRRWPGVVSAESYWTERAPELRASDHKSALVLIRLGGDDSAAERLAGRIVPAVTGVRGPLRIRATGSAEVNREATDQSSSDLARAEAIAAPLTLLILAFAFGSSVAAALPVLMGLVAVAGTFAMLQVFASFTTMSVFSQNITTALGFALAVDFSLFMVTRYREEVAAGRPVSDAVLVTVRRAGRTVLFSAATVAMAMAGLLAFPVPFMRSLAIAGMAVAVLAGLTAVAALPGLLVVLGGRIGRGGAGSLARRGRRGRHRAPRAPDAGLLHTLATVVMRRPVLLGVLAIVFLAVLGAPFTSARFGLTDDQQLPPTLMARQAADRIRADFPDFSPAPAAVVLPAVDRRSEIDRYARDISSLSDVARVDTWTGSYAAGKRLAPARSAGFRAGGGTWLEVGIRADPSSEQARRVVAGIRGLPAPGAALVAGDSALLVDTLAALRSSIPLAAVIMLASMFLVLFLYTGSVVVPVKAAAVAMLSLTASLGALVWIFQEGHLQGVIGNFTVTGRLEVTMPVVMFCIAFGVSMDYEMFLLARIKEEYDLTGDTAGAVARGLQRNGRVITAAAVTVATILGALATSDLVFLKMFGVGMAVSLLVDATVVRCVLVPALMRLAGDLNWWAPTGLLRLRARFVRHEEPVLRSASGAAAFPG